MKSLYKNIYYKDSIFSKEYWTPIFYELIYKFGSSICISFALLSDVSVVFIVKLIKLYLG